MFVHELIENKALNNARSVLRNEQRKYANIELTSSFENLVPYNALKRLEELTRFVQTKDPQLVRRGTFKYDFDLECRRIEQAQAIIRRVAPSQFEDPNYIAFLSYQAASIEMAYKHLAGQSTENDRFSKFLLGTVHAPEINAYAKKISSNGYSVIILYSGLVDLIYQAAKVVVEALNPSQTVKGQSAVNALYDLEMIRASLESNTGPVERLYGTLEAYFFDGYPRKSALEEVPAVHIPLLSLIVGMAERWVIGHEYGHGFTPQRDLAPQSGTNKRSEEYFADCNATITSVLSAGKLDVVPPEFPVGGAIFALACLDIIQKGFNILLTGNDTGFESESASHPKPKDRAVEVIKCVRQYFDVNYHPNGLFDLSFVLRKEAPPTHTFTSEHSKRAFACSNVLQTVWNPVKERLLNDFRSKRPLHSHWQ